MEFHEISASIKVAACVCARDGLISHAEETMMFKIISEKFSGYSLDQFNSVIDEFFNSNDQIENYLQAITNTEIREFTLYLAKNSACADGLDFRENIAIQKAYLTWGIEPNE